VPSLEELVIIASMAAFVWIRLRLFMRAPLRRLAPEALFAGYVAALSYVVIFASTLHGYRGSGGIWSMVNVVPLRTILELARPEHVTQATRQLGGNVVLFVPFGVLLPIIWARFHSLKQLLLAAALASLGIELLQLALGLAGLLSRSIDVDDVVLNTLGAAVGWAVWRSTLFLWRAAVPSVTVESVPPDSTW
jgi:glycopeptide antibiotics resistance protein